MNIKKLAIGLAIMILTLAKTNTAFAGNYTPGQISEISSRMMSGLPTTELEQIGIAAPNLNVPVVPSDTGYIILGDSRSCGINIACQVNNTPDNWFVVAAAGEGYDYFVNFAIPYAQMVENAHPEINHWKYIICLGVNDLGRKLEFYNTISNLSLTKDVTFVSVNPIVDNACLSNSGKTTSRIIEFNSLMAAIPTIRYIDTYSTLIETGFITEPDGLHYTIPQTQVVYSMIKSLA